MANACKLFFIVLFLAFVAKGQCQCSVEKLRTYVSKTGHFVQKKPEWEVVVRNPCPCSVDNVKLSCAGFQSSETLDPSVLSKSGDVCLINAGKPIDADSDFSFNYAWDYMFDFKPISCDFAFS